MNQQSGKMRVYIGLFTLLSISCIAVIPLGCSQRHSNNQGGNINDIKSNQIQEQPTAELPSPAKVLPPCKETTCIDLDPKDTGCAQDARTLTIKEFQSIEIELRYSIKCQASWARSTAPISSVIYTEDTQGQKYGLYTITRDGYQQHYSSMGPGRKLKACFQVPDQELQCTELIQ
ncbi:MAG: DUF2690 domain-containing protein [Symploca sp. SIO1C2]|nr:DUF2690 domain-containing protein [Symploca sp. SIO1C2]